MDRIIVSVVSTSAMLFSAASVRAGGVDQPQPYRAARVSSADGSGANHDFVTVSGSSRHTVAEMQGAGRIVHMWFTLAPKDPAYLHKTRLQIYWDGQDTPAVDVPFGDFHALGHGTVRLFHNAFMSVEARPLLNHNLADKNVGGFNNYFPMPYAKGAKIVIDNTSDKPIAALYYQIDYQQWASPPSPLRFHARYSESPAGPAENPPGYPKNPDGRFNHLILDTQGKGHFIGVVLSVDALTGGWWEGDDMTWVDGEERASIVGTGTEDYFGGAWGFRQEYHTPQHGVTVLEKVEGREDWRAGRYTVYRFCEKDPVPFTRSFRMSIERGHANDRRNCIYSSVAYWYQE
ncbi:MAG: DUF2961 domain-containing protein [Planctomycetes bacterium]|nr:DUF2961 domain-containing protein [Planctomycetota bacterium]